MRALSSTLNAVRCLVSVGAIAIGFVVPGAPAAAQAKYVAKFSLTEPPSAPSTLAYTKLFDEIRKQTKGEVDFQVFPSSQLGGIREGLEGMRLGSIQAMPGSSGFLTTYAPITGIFDLPFVFRNDDHAQKSCNLVFEKAEPELVKNGYRNLGCLTSGGRHLISTFPIKALADIKGKKHRVIQNQSHIDMWKLAGANPAPIPFAEVYTGLQTRVIDYLDNNKANYYTSKLYEVAKYYTILGHIYSVDGFLVAEPFWQRLPADHRKVVAEVIGAGMPSITDAWVKPADELLEKAVKEGGSQVSEITDKEPWKKAMMPMYEAFYATVPQAREVVARIEAVK